MSGTRAVVVIGYPGAELVDIACVTSCFDLANRMGALPGYDVRLTAVEPRLRCDSGLELTVPVLLADIETPVDTVVISGGTGHDAASRDADFIAAVKRVMTGARRTASVCTGATVLACTGVLDGRRATTHWHYADRLAARFPAVTVDPNPIYINEGGVATSGGVTSALDLSLALVAEDHGHELARRVAMGMVTYLQRPANQSQMSAFVSRPIPNDAALRRVVEWVTAHIDEELTTEQLAREAGVSARHLSRLFAAHLGETPAQVVRRMRLELATDLLAGTDLGIAQIARRIGYGSSESFRQSFLARYGVPPSEFRSRNTIAR